MCVSGLVFTQHHANNQIWRIIFQNKSAKKKKNRKRRKKEAGGEGQSKLFTCTRCQLQQKEEKQKSKGWKKIIYICYMSILFKASDNVQYTGEQHYQLFLTDDGGGG